MDVQEDPQEIHLETLARLERVTPRSTTEPGFTRELRQEMLATMRGLFLQPGDSEEFTRLLNCLADSYVTNLDVGLGIVGQPVFVNAVMVLRALEKASISLQNSMMYLENRFWVILELSKCTLSTGYVYTYIGRYRAFDLPSELDLLVEAVKRVPRRSRRIDRLLGACYLK